MSSEPVTTIERMLIDNSSYRICPLGIDFKGDISRDEWIALGQKLGSAGRSIGFLIGDWLNYGNGKGSWGDTYSEAMKITGLENKTLRNYASVSRKVHLSLRKDNLPFEVHCKVAPIKDPQDQEKWLKIAQKQAQNGTPVSSRRLAKSIVIGRLAKEEEMQTEEIDRGRKSAQLHVLRLMTFWKKAKEKDFLNTASLYRIRNLMTDLQPVLEMYDELHQRAVDMESNLPGDQETIAVDWRE